MRTVAEYLAKAAEFDELAKAAPAPGLTKRYSDLADCYRLLAGERKRLISDGMLELWPENVEANRLAHLIELHEEALGLKRK